MTSKGLLPLKNGTIHDFKVEEERENWDLHKYGTLLDAHGVSIGLLVKRKKRASAG